jgi:hypothetical protein
MNLKHMGILALAVLAVAMVAGCTSASTVTRTISPGTVAPGGTVTVTLNVDVNNERFYIIEEIPPAGWEVVDSGIFIVDPQGHLKWVQLQNAADTTYTFTMKAPSVAGSYEFTGIYQMDGMDNSVRISGPSTATVS